MKEGPTRRIPILRKEHEGAILERRYLKGPTIGREGFAEGGGRPADFDECKKDSTCLK